EVVAVLGLLLRHPAAVLAFALVDAAAVGDHVHVAVRRQEARVAGLDAAVPQRARRRLRHGLKRLLPLAVRREREQRRERTVAERSIHVDRESYAVAHRNEEIALDGHLIHPPTLDRICPSKGLALAGCPPIRSRSGRLSRRVSQAGCSSRSTARSAPLSVCSRPRASRPSSPWSRLPRSPPPPAAASAASGPARAHPPGCGPAGAAPP